MLLRHFLADLDTLRHRLSDWDEVNVDGLRLGTHGLEMTVDETETAAALAEARETIAELEATVKEMEKADEEEDKRVAELEHELDTMREELAALKDPSDEAATVLTYRDRANEAEKQVGQWQEHCRAHKQRVDEMAAELSAMRKRKGVEPGVMACSRDVWQFVCSMASKDDTRYDKGIEETVARHRQEATRLRDKIAAKV